MTEDGRDRFVRATLCIFRKRRLCIIMDQIDGRIIEIIILELFSFCTPAVLQTDFDAICKMDMIRFSTLDACAPRVRKYCSFFNSESPQYRNAELFNEDKNDGLWCSLLKSEMCCLLFKSESPQYANMELLTEDENDTSWCRNCLLKFDTVFCARKEKWIFARKRCTRCQQVFCGKQCFKRAWNFGNHKLKCLKHL